MGGGEVGRPPAKWAKARLARPSSGAFGQSGTGDKEAAAAAPNLSGVPPGTCRSSRRHRRARHRCVRSETTRDADTAVPGLAVRGRGCPGAAANLLIAHVDAEN